MGYSDAEHKYRLILDKEAKPQCTDAIKEWVEEFARKNPLPYNTTFKPTAEGIDDFYKDWKNQSVPLELAQEICLVSPHALPGFPLLGSCYKFS